MRGGGEEEGRQEMVEESREMLDERLHIFVASPDNESRVDLLPSRQ